MGVWYGAAGAVGGGLMGILATTAMGYVASQRSKSREAHDGKDATVQGGAGTESLAAAILATAAETEDEKHQVLRNASDASVKKEAPEGLGMTEVVLASTILLGVIAVSNVGVPSTCTVHLRSRNQTHAE